MLRWSRRRKGAWTRPFTQTKGTHTKANSQRHTHHEFRRISPLGAQTAEREASEERPGEQSSPWWRRLRRKRSQSFHHRSRCARSTASASQPPPAQIEWPSYLLYPLPRPDSGHTRMKYEPSRLLGYVLNLYSAIIVFLAHLVRWDTGCAICISVLGVVLCDRYIRRLLGQVHSEPVRTCPPNTPTENCVGLGGKSNYWFLARKSLSCGLRAYG